MSASPEPQAGDVREKIAPTPGDDEGHENSAEPAKDDAAVTSEEQDDDEDDAAKLSDDESVLSEVDEAQFENFDPEEVLVEDRPQLAIDEENLKLIGRHKRKRTGDGDGPRRKKEGRREKKSRRAQDEEEGEEGSSRRKEQKKRVEQPDTDEETLDPETRKFCMPWFIDCD